MFAPEELELLRRRVADAVPGGNAQCARGRVIVDQEGNDFLVDYARRILPRAREVFGRDTIVPSYSLCFRYEGTQAHLERHKDDHANSYTIGCCVEQRTPWPLWIEGEPYTLRENEAIAFHGTEQEHWRQAFPDPETNVVTMAFFNFVEPDHWFVQMGQHYVAIRRLIARALSEVSDPEHQRFLTLLNEAGSPVELYDLVRRRIPCEEPVEKVFEWIEGLCTAPNPLHLCLNGSMRKMARALAEGKSTDQILSEVNATRRDPAPRETVVRALSDLRSSPLAMLFPQSGGRPYFEVHDRGVSLEPTLTAELTVAGRKVYVLDDVLVARVRSDVYSQMRDLPYRFADVDSDRTAFARHLVHDIDDAERMRLPFVDAIHEMARRFLERRGHEAGPLERVYANFNLFGDYQFRHYDGRVWSVLTFLNDEWSSDWAGELLYYDEHNPRAPVWGIVPEPGRTVIFDGLILHRGGVPSKYHGGPRISLAIKLVKP